MYTPLFIEWLEKGYRQIFLKVESEERLFKSLESCQKLGMSTAVIRDAGRTQVVLRKDRLRLVQ